jgi:hypothetical protein
MSFWRVAMPSEETERKIDIACLIILPISFIAMGVLGILGYSMHKDEGYATAVQFVSIFAVIILPIMRLKRIFMAPYWFIFVMTANIYMFSIMLFLGVYDNIWWWDHFSHWLSSVLVAMIVFIALLIIENYTTRISIPKGVLLFMTFVFGLALGCVWEMWEAGMDGAFWEGMMVYDVFDTLGDLWMDALGSATMAVLGAIILHFKTPEQIVGRIGLDHKMRRIGERWDARCDGRRKNE